MSDFEDQIVALAQAANARETQALRRASAELAKENFGRVAVHFAFACLHLALCVAAQQMTKAGRRAEVKHEGAGSLALYVSGKPELSCRYSLGDEHVEIYSAGVGFGQREKWEPTQTLDPSALYAEATGVVLQLCKRMLGGA
jgi:hypothetical protein